MTLNISDDFNLSEIGGITPSILSRVIAYATWHPDEPTPTGDWVLPTISQWSAGLEGRVISPKSDAITDLNGGVAYYRKCHSQMPYRVRICVKGMSWPFQYSINDAPDGATIGAELTRTVDADTGRTVHEWNDEYAIVEWLTTTAGTHDFSITVTDQDGATVSESWTVEQDDDAFVFANMIDGDDATGDGSYSNPLQTFIDGVWEGDDDASTYAGKIAVFMGDSVYPVGNGTVNAHNIPINTSVKPATYMTEWGSTATLDTSNAYFFSLSTTQEDLSFVNINISGSKSDVDNNRIFNLGSVSDRITFWGVSFSNVTAGLEGDDNPCCIGFFDNSTARNDLAIVDCSIDDTVECKMVVTFACRYVLVERPQALTAGLTAVNGGDFINIKDDTSDVTVRCPIFYGSAARSVISMSNQISEVDFGQASNQEVGWGTIIFTGDQVNADAAVLWNTQTSSVDGLNTHEGRMTIISNAYADAYYSGSGDPVTVSGVLRVSGANLGSVKGSNFVEGAQTSVDMFASDFDSEGKLTGTARDTHLGIRGGEVASYVD